MIRMAMMLGLILAIGACSNLRRDRLAFDGQYYRSNAARVDGDRREIEVSVRPVSASLKGAQEAGRYEATGYCVNNFGSSLIAWTVGPDDDPDSYVLNGDTLVLRGTCTG